MAVRARLERPVSPHCMRHARFRTRSTAARWWVDGSELTLGRSSIAVTDRSGHARPLIFHFVDVRVHAAVNDANEYNNLAQLVNVIGDNVRVDWVVP